MGVLGKQSAGRDAGAAVNCFPPAGWMTNRQTAERLGVSLNTLTCNAWRWRVILRDAARTVRMPGGGRCNLYPVELIERLSGERESEARGPVIPEGMVDKDGACQFFGITRMVWKTWIRQGKVTCGQRVASSGGGRKTLYAIADLERLREQLFGQDKLFKRSDNTYHVPSDFIRREEAWTRFGVSKPTWERWERQGQIACGMQVPGGPKLYRVADIESLIAVNGVHAPPYPDPDHPGVMRIPLNGHHIKRREAIIDAADLPLIDGGSCAFSPSEFGGYVAFSRGEMRGIPLRRIVLNAGSDDVMNVRHVNGDPLDCRRENLVLRTTQQRIRNARKTRAIDGRPPTSIFKGVCWETQTRKWRASIRVDGKTKRLGRFGDQMQAAQAYDEAARTYFGEHARLNFPHGIDAWIKQYHESKAAA